MLFHMQRCKIYDIFFDKTTNSIRDSFVSDGTLKMFASQIERAAAMQQHSVMSKFQFRNRLHKYLLIVSFFHACNYNFQDQIAK